MARTALQRRRRGFQAGFFLLFVLAPPLDLLRIDLTRGHAVLLGMDWTLGIDDFLAGQAGIGEAAFNLFWRGFLPLIGGGALFLWIAWRFGRLYCGWLCPHFSVVEMLNGLMRRASGKPSLWEPRPLPAHRADGSLVVPNKGTNATGSTSRASTPPSSRLRSTTSCCPKPRSTGMTRLAPGRSCSTSGWGTCGAAAVTRMPSNGACSGQPR